MALFSLSDEAWAAIDPHRSPSNRRGAGRGDDRRVIPGVVPMPEMGCRWCDRPGDAWSSHDCLRPAQPPVAPGIRFKPPDALAATGAVTRSSAIDAARGAACCCR